MGSQMTVGEAARRAGLSAKALRLYEARGILPKASRTVSGYRLYSEEDVQLLRWVRGARALGLTLTEIRRILDLRREGRQPCQHLTELIESHVNNIDQAVADLRGLQDALVAILNDGELRRSRGEGFGYCEVVRVAGESASPDRDGLIESGGARAPAQSPTD